MSTVKSSKTTSLPLVGDVKQLEEVAVAQQETLETATKLLADVTKLTAEKVVALGKEHTNHIVKTSISSYKGYEDIIAFNKENVDAIVHTGSQFVKGIQDIAQSFFTLAHQSFDETLSGSKALLSAKNVKEAVEISTSLFKNNLDKYLVETNKITLATSKVTNEAIESINNRVEVTINKFAA